MKFPENISVTDQFVNLSILSDSQKDYFLELAKKIRRLYSESNKSRYVVSLSGPSGSGKSVLSIILYELLKNEMDFAFYPVDLDSFHFTNDYLKSHDLSDVKGRYDTYDVEKLNKLLLKFKSGEKVKFPAYSRKLHEPTEDGPEVFDDNAVVLLAGLWFQRDDKPWEKIREYIDYSFVIEGNEDSIRKNTIKRHIKGGRSEKEALDFYNNSDYKNNQEIRNSSVAGDEILKYYENI